MRYNYKCAECDACFEVEKGIKDPPPSSCPKCGATKVERSFGPDDAPSILYKGRPIWTYNDAKKYKTCSQDGGPVRRVDPSKHGDLASWNSPGEIIRKKK